MRTINLFLSAIMLTITSQICYSQVAGNAVLNSGNVNYNTVVQYPDYNINVGGNPNSNLIFSIKGLANLKADSYVAIFNVTQVGLTTEEVNKLIDSRIEEALKNVRGKEGVETYVDMLTFVPVYEYEVEKKIFSKKTYNEIPAGFEVKKNIHVKYKDPELLNMIISEFANAEIYDLVKVDYFSNVTSETKQAMIEKARKLVEQKLKNYEAIIDVKMDSMDKYISDGFKMVYPIEMYKSYQAYTNSSLNLRKTASVNQAAKSTTLYYQPVVDKEFDFVINPTILEPVIQVMYEVKINVLIVKKPKQVVSVPKTKKEYILVTPNGDLKTIYVD